MVLEKIKQLALSVVNALPGRHPFDPLSPGEIEEAVSLIRHEHESLYFNAVTLQEPRKDIMTAWLADPEKAPRPPRVADVVAIGKGSQVFDGLVDLDEKKIVQWETTKGVQPLVRRGAIRRKGYSWLADHHGRPSGCRTHCAQRPQGDRAVRNDRHSFGRYAQGLLRS